MGRKLLIIGYGSAGRRFANIAKKNYKNLEIIIHTKQKKIGFTTLSNIKELKNLKPDFVIIASSTKFHFYHLSLINKYLKNTRVLVEKPLFDKFRNVNKKKNKIFVGYNMRNLKMIKFLKSIILHNKKKIYEIELINHSYLPEWRKNIDYKNSSSAKKKFGGGVILDCSHEIDLATWFLGSINILFVDRSKKSDLKINTEDYCKVYGVKKKINVIIDLNYFSIIRKRKINIVGNNFQIEADLSTSKITISRKNKKKIIKNFKKNEMNKTYFLELKGLLNNNKQYLTDLDSAMKTQKLIQNIQNF